MSQALHTSSARVMDSLDPPTVSIEDTPCSRTSSLEDLYPWGPANLPACSPATLTSSVHTDHTCTVYRPWFSPYSYFLCTKEAPQKYQGSLSTSLACSTPETKEADNLSETICSSPNSSDKPQHPKSERQARGEANITVQDILNASQLQLVSQHGYQCMSCCRIFPTIWSIRTHIKHSSQEGYSCKVYYRKLKALCERELKKQEAAARRVPV
ncbi:spermatogenesis-associated protein 46 [Apus apus]|uniref:spermatogenesis-associated protein 46 n=1 Tax=Apus apus TaxID=8895 RepID=UPI0021F8E579|nr:spermatogenesis-associated protein 46 [Apus apus]